MGRAGFLRENAPWLAAGGLLTFGSSFGQTYFISIFAGEIRTEYGLSHADWGAIYAGGTLASAALMLVAGGIVDRFRARALAAVNLLLFAGLCLGMATAPAGWVLPFLIFGLRFCGQGMMGHLAIVSVGRWFRAARGRAIAVTSMGFSVGEAVLPMIFVAVMGAMGWRFAWVAAAALLVVYIPILFLLLRRERSPRGQADADLSPGMEGRHWRRGEALRHWLFWACVPGLVAQPAFGTAFFFQQVHLVETKGWTLEAFAALFPVYTAATLVSLLAGGALVDRFGTTRMMPLYLWPLVAGLVVVSASDSILGGAVGMALLGTMQGLSSSTLGAFWPEHYGTRYLGSIRSVTAALMVFSTALGPLMTGILIDLGMDYDHQLRLMAGLAAASSLVLLFAARRIRAAGLLPAA